MPEIPALPAGIESQRLEVDGRSVRYLKAGNGPAAVLVHGGASDARDWLDTMQALGGRFTFYAPDLPGFGESARDKAGYYISDFAGFLLGFMDALKIENPVLIGHSFGARAGLDAALQAQERIKKLVLIDASGLGKMSSLGSFLFTFFWALREVLRQPQPFPKMMARPGDDYDNIDAARLRGLKVPTLIVWKSFDPYMPVKLARRANKLIPGSRLEIIRGYGHAPFKQKDPGAFRRVLLEFLKE